MRDGVIQRASPAVERLGVPVEGLGARGSALLARSLDQRPRGARASLAGST